MKLFQALFFALIKLAAAGPTLEASLISAAKKTAGSFLGEKTDIASRDTSASRGSSPSSQSLGSTILKEHSPAVDTSSSASADSESESEELDEEERRALKDLVQEIARERREDLRVQEKRLQTVDELLSGFAIGK